MLQGEKNKSGGEKTKDSNEGAAHKDTSRGGGHLRQPDLNLLPIVTVHGITTRAREGNQVSKAGSCWQEIKNQVVCV